jgi:hypothetical protein
MTTSNTVSIQVFILQTQATKAQSTNVSNLFSFTSAEDTSAPSEGKTVTFSVAYVSAVPQSSSTGSSNNNDETMCPDRAEYNAVKTCLASPAGTGKYVLFCLDTSISSASAENIYYTIKELVNLNETNSQNWDLCYLCKWMDNCSVYKNIVPNVGETSAKIVQTLSPFGFQSVLFSPAGATKLTDLLNTLGNFQKPLNLTLHDQVSTDTWTATAIVPNLISFDPEMARPGSIDYIRTAECRDPVPIQTPFKDSNLNFMWFLVLVVIVVLLIWICIRLGAVLENRKGASIMSSGPTTGAISNSIFPSIPIDITTST